MSLTETYAPHHFKGAKILRSFEQMDAMPRELRECVNEFGMPIVQACLQMKVTEPRHIRQLVTEIWNGARQIHQRRQSAARDSLDWILMQAGAEISAATLLRVLASNNFAVVPLSPTRAMLDASMDAVHHMGRVSKEQKHRNRLIAALKAGAMGDVL